MLKDAISLAVDRMIREYEFSGGVSHDGEKGAFREYFVHDLLKPLLPAHFKITSGVVVDYSGKQSLQSDVVIYDDRLMPPIFSRGDNSLVPIDSVLRVIEVKSTLNPDGLRQLEKAASCFNVNNHNALKIVNHREGDIEEPNYPFLSALAYTSSAKKMDEFKRLKQYAPSNHQVIKCLTVVNKGAWCTSNPVHLSAEPVENIRRYLVHLLDELETDSSSRSKFQLSRWLR